jgi:NifU-like protein involved in Fe-S cluster formation
MTTDPDLVALYEIRVRRWAAKVRNDRRLLEPDLSITRTSPICGSTLTLDIKHNQETISALGYRARACTLGMASTAIVVQNAIGKSFADLMAVGTVLRQILSGELDAISGEWSELDVFVAARPFKTRHASIMLPYDILVWAAAAAKHAGNEGDRKPVAAP